MQKLNAGTKRRECAHKGTYLCWQRATALRQAPRASRKLDAAAPYAADRCLWFSYRCCPQTNCVRRRAAYVPKQLGAEPLTRCPHGRAPRASSYGRNPRAARAIGLAGGRGLYPTASSQPTARGRAPARLRALERAPWRTPNPGLLLDHILYFWICRLLSPACCSYGGLGPCARLPPSNH